MIINDRVRNMSDAEKMKHYLDRLTDDLSRVTKDEIIEQVSKLAKGVEPSEFLKTFNLKGEYKEGKKDDGTSPSIVVQLDEGKSITIEISDTERRWFIEPQPVEPEPPRSILPQDELDELNHG